LMGKYLQPPGAAMISPQLGSSRQITLTDDSDQLSMFVDNRESTDSVPEQNIGNLSHRGVRTNRNYIHDHDVPGSHPGYPLQAIDGQSNLVGQGIADW